MFSKTLKFFNVIFSYINSYLERREHNGQTIQPGWEEDLEDIVIRGPKTSTRISRKQVKYFY